MISILLPTLGTRIEELKRLFESLEAQSDDDFELIVITQDNHEEVKQLIKKYKIKYKHVKIDVRGLSIARNIGMKYVEGNKVILSDDDAWYPETGIADIKLAFEKEKEDILCFQIYDPIKGELYKNYDGHNKRVRNRQLLKKSSIEICIDLDKVSKEKILFNETFGLGAKYISGEENLLLDKLIREGYKCGYIPNVVVYHRKKDKVIFDKKYIESKAMLFKMLYGKVMGIIMINLLLIKKYSLIEGNKVALLKMANKIIFSKENMEVR